MMEGSGIYDDCKKEVGNIKYPFLRSFYESENAKVKMRMKTCNI